MAKTAKKAKKKSDEAEKAASTATPEATPPVEALPKGEPAGGWLKWEQPSKDTWLAPDPGGDLSRAGARIKMSSRAWQGHGEGPLYSVYRDSEYLGCDSSLEAAQRRAQYREKSLSYLSDQVQGGGMPAFLNLTPQERAATRDKGRVRPSPPVPRTVPPAPAAAPAALATGPVARAAAAAPAQGQPPEPPGQAPAARVDVAARVGAASTAAKPKLRAGKIPGTAVIRAVTKTNPRRTGTGQHTRYEQILAHDGKTVAEYVAASGHLDALTYAVEGKHVNLEGVE